MSADPGLLMVARLTIRSSYGQDIELPAADGFDTVQFYLPGGADVIYRVRTFALDHDIHVHQIGRPAEPEGLIRANFDSVYGQVLAGVHRVPLQRLSTQDLIDAGITGGELEIVAEPGYAFWNPDGAEYVTKSEPAGPGERQGMAPVVYLGGIARFWLPDSWRLEMSVEHGGEFYPPDGDTVLRLNVLTFNTPEAAAPGPLRHALKPGERAIDGGRLVTGHDFDVYEIDDLQEGTRLRFWQIAQVLPTQCRIYVFSYAYPINDDEKLRGELAMVDREVRRMVPYPEAV